MHDSIKLLDEIKPTKNAVFLASFKGFSDTTGAAAASIEFLIDDITNTHIGGGNKI